ncbi:hypothetical protein DD606_25340 [Enterobacter cloacae complex sp. GF14B]|nr:hypothetical protein DD606_25340 [Enterobacter cloacae complex sp. GF14B]
MQVNETERRREKRYDTREVVKPSSEGPTLVDESGLFFDCTKVYNAYAKDYATWSMPMTTTMAEI